MSNLNAIRATSVTPISRSTVQGGGGTVAPTAAASILPQSFDADTLSMGLRVAEPAVKLAADHMGWLQNLFHHGNAPVPPMPAPGPGMFSTGGALAGTGGGAGSAISGALKTFGAALKSNFLVSAAVSVISDGLGLVTGKLSAKRAAASIGVDTLAYTGIGATATTIGATLGSLIPIPFVGTLLGIAAGFGIGLLYEKVARKPLVDSVESAVFKTTA